MINNFDRGGGGGGGVDMGILGEMSHESIGKELSLH